MNVNYISQKGTIYN